MPHAQTAVLGQSCRVNPPSNCQTAADNTPSQQEKGCNVQLNNHHSLAAPNTQHWNNIRRLCQPANEPNAWRGFAAALAVEKADGTCPFMSCKQMIGPEPRQYNYNPANAQITRYPRDPTKQDTLD
jgi:hypothetical protein